MSVYPNSCLILTTQNTIEPIKLKIEKTQIANSRKLRKYLYNRHNFFIFTLRLIILVIPDVFYPKLVQSLLV